MTDNDRQLPTINPIGPWPLAHFLPEQSKTRLKNPSWSHNEAETTHLNPKRQSNQPRKLSTYKPIKYFPCTLRIQAILQYRRTV